MRKFWINISSTYIHSVRAWRIWLWHNPKNNPYPVLDILYLYIDNIIYWHLKIIICIVQENFKYNFWEICVILLMQTLEVKPYKTYLHNALAYLISILNTHYYIFVAPRKQANKFHICHSSLKLPNDQLVSQISLVQM